MSRMRRVAMVFLGLWLLGTLAGMLCWRPVEAQLPPRGVVDTRELQIVQLDSAVTDTLLAVYAAGGRRERAACLFGHAFGDTLRIERAQTAHIYEADSVRVIYACPDDAPDFVGTMHTHVLESPLCIPSPSDFAPLLLLPRALVIYIFCANGQGYIQFVDGRWSWFSWPSLSRKE